MDAEWIIVDGNNLLHHDPAVVSADGAMDFASARWALARRLDQLAGEMGARITLVFDGTRGRRHAASLGLTHGGRCVLIAA